MEPSKLPVGVLMILPVVIGFGLYAFTTQAEEVEDPNAATPTATIDRLIDANASDDGYWATQTAAAGGPTLSPDDGYATYTAGQPTPTPEVTRRGDFHDGARVRVNAGAGDCLNARNTPSLANEYVIVNICVPDGYEGVIAGHAEQGDGRWWWNLAGMGWVAEEFLTYTGEFNGRDNVVAELSGVAGKVAFLRSNDVWMMRPDGSGQTLLVDHPENGDTYVPQPTDMAWSPDGSRLSYNVPRYDVINDPQQPGSVDLHVLTIREPEPVQSQVFAGVAGGGWSADGMHLGIVRDASPDQMGSGFHGVPAILDVTTGGQLVLGSEPGWHQKAPSFNHDGSLLMASESIFDGTTYNPSLVIYTTGGLEYDRIDFANDGSFGYASPQWAPDANRIAMHISRQQGETFASAYEIYDVSTRTFSGSAAPPKTSDRIGGRCGGGDMWNTEWTLDGGRVLYSFMLGDTGANGILSWDIASGVQRVIYAANAASPTGGPGNIVMFSSNSYPLAHIFYGSSDGGFPRIITDGSSAVWWVP